MRPAWWNHRRLRSSAAQRPWQGTYPPHLETLEDRCLLSSAVAAEAYGRLPLVFEPNVGQAPAQVDYVAHGPGYGLGLTAGGATLNLQGKTSATIQMELVGAGKGALSLMEGTAEDLQPGVANYVVGKDTGQWRLGVPTYGRVTYRGVYSGIDVTYYGSDQQKLEYDFSLAANASASAIGLRFVGASSLQVNAQGVLIIHTGGGDVIEQAPVVYQDIGGSRQTVAGRYVLQDAQTVGFALGAYDHARPLTIDPVLSYSTFLGGSGMDGAFGIRVDASGNAYVAGRTFSLDFPTVSPAQTTSGGGKDAFIAKLDPTGTHLLYATYLGGAGNDEALNISVDSAGNAYVTGDTQSSNFPTANAFHPSFGGIQDAFVAKLNASGSVLYSTYLGGSGFDEGLNIAVDGGGAAYVVGDTQSTNFPVAGPLQPTFGGGSPPDSGDGFLVKLNPAGTALAYGAYLGGGLNDIAEDVIVDAAGNAYVSGATTSTNFPLASPIQATYAGGLFDTFVAEVNSAGTAFVYSTLLGGNADDTAYGLAVDGAGNAYVAGYTNSPNFPVVNALQGAKSGDYDAFLTKITTGGASIAYSTFLGGLGTDFAQGVAVDSAGNAYLTGSTTSTNFPTANAVQSRLAGGADAFVAKVNAAGNALVYSSYLGGVGNDFGNRIALDPAGNAYVVGETGSVDFPVLHAARPSIAGSDDGFVTKINTARVGPPINPGAVLSAVTVPGTSIMFALTKDDRLYRYVPATGWALLGGNIQQISAVAEPASGRAVVFVVTNDQGLYRFDDATGWQAIGAPGTIVSVSAGTDSNGRAAAFVRTTAADLQEFRGSTGWLASPLGARGTIIQISATASDTVVAVSADHSVFQYSGSAGWQRLAGREFAVSVSAITETSGRVVVFARTLDEALFRYDAAAGWSLLGSPGTIRAAAAGTDSAGQANVFVLTTNNDFIEYDPLSGWTVINPPKTVFEISPTASDRVFVTLADGSVFLRDPQSGLVPITSPGFAHL